jgi:hypothetical protein
LKLRINKTISVLFTAMIVISVAKAQSSPTATQPLRISAFGGATGTFTGLESGKNLGITAGIDLTARPFYSFYPSLEVRGTYPFAEGHIDSQRNILVGLKVEKFYDRLRPYADILFGRGSIHYENGGFPDPSNTFLYLQSPSNVLSVGGGADYNLTDRFAVKAEVQFQRYSTPVTVSGYLYAKPITVGLVYRFDFNHRGHVR